MRVDLLGRSLQTLVSRHESLRTTFHVEDREPVQVIAPVLVLPFSLVDIESLADRDREKQARRLATESASKVFDLEKGPLVRVSLLRLTQGAYVLLLNMHHIISDGWSMGVFIREMILCYQAYLHDEEPCLPELPIQYADFAVWQRQWLRDEILDAHLDFWKSQLGDHPPTLALPLDAQYKPFRAHRGATRRFAISESRSRAWKALGRKAGATAFMSLLAVFKVLLYRYSNQNQIIVGSPIANRNRAELEPLIGFFVNTLALRTDLAGNISFRELLSRIREMTLGAYAYQDLPFEKLVEELQPERDLGLSPLFQVMFIFQNTPEQEQSAPGLRMRPLKTEHGVARFDLTLTVTDTGKGFVGSMTYDVDLFETATIDRLLAHFHVLLEAVLMDPEKQIAGLALNTESEKQQILFAWNDTDRPAYRESMAMSLFQDLVHLQPDATALCFVETAPEEGGLSSRLSYAALDSRANRLGHYLRKQGVGPETLVGICMERSLEMIVSVLAALKAGAAYCPLDPAYPEDRLAYMIETSRIAVLLTGSEPPAALSRHGAQIICPNADWIEISKEPNAALMYDAMPENLAYLIFTSGTTGKPNGVPVSHLGLVNMAYTQRESLRLSSASRILQFSSFSFDASVWEIFSALLSGAALFLTRRENLIPGPELISLILRQAITNLTLPPSALSAFPENPLPSLQTVVTAGEACTESLVNRWGAGRRFINAYGPTEATVCATLTICRPDGGKPMIGRPIPNAKAYLLSPYLQPVAIGVIGELCLHAIGLARGYLNRPDLTASKFVPDHLSGEHGQRIYRTGDLARYRTDGQIEYIGRIDHQVKLRGFRIELAEIESLLSTHPQIREAIVLIHERTTDKQLAAYLAPEETGLDDTRQKELRSELAHFLKDKLPDYMIPSIYVFRHAFPVSPNGKIDRDALKQQALFGETESEAPDNPTPRGPTEEILVDIFADVLHRKRVGVKSNFFELGGHSLLATQVISRIRQIFKLELPLRHLFESPTVEGLASRIEEARRQRQALPTPPILAVSREKPLPLSFAQRRLWFLDQLEPGSPLYNIPVAVRITGPLQINALTLAINNIIARHEILRTSFRLQDSDPVQIISPVMAHSVPVFDFQGLPESCRSALLQKLTSQYAGWTFDLARGPLLKIGAIRLDFGQHVLMINMHHIISDGWSMGVFVREIAVLYQDALDQKPTLLPDLPIQYADFAVWQKQWLKGEILTAQLDYWRQKLGDRPQPLMLPTDYPRPSRQNHRGGAVAFTLDAPISLGLRELSRQKGLTSFMALLAAYKTLLARYSGQNDITIGFPIANRNRTEIEPLIGFFVNTLALRSDLSDNPTFAELLRRVRDNLLDAYAHQDLPFEKLVEEIQPERDLSRSPIFQAMFVYQNNPDEEHVLKDLNFQPIRNPSEMAKFDLTLTMADREQQTIGSFGFNSGLFEEGSMKRLSSHFQKLIEQVVENPDLPVEKVSFLTDSERRQALRDWNRTRDKFHDPQCLHQLFQKMAAIYPDRIALVYERQRLSYYELNRRANRLAHLLRFHNVHAETPVGIFSNRSLEIMIGLIAILKAGGFFLPLDPELPHQRIAFMLRGSDARVVLAQPDRFNDLAETETTVLGLEDWPTYPDSDPGALLNRDHAAYLIYTSGSTGEPKGVVISHGNLLNYCHGIQARVSFESDHSFAVVSTLSADLGNTMLFPALLLGGALHIISGQRIGDPHTFAAYFQHHRIHCLKITPSHLSALMDQAHPEWVLPSRKLILGGEATPVALPIRIQALAPQLQIYNHYGPSETTVGVATHLFSEGDRAFPLGSPLSNTRLFSLNAQAEPVGIGLPGELYISGDGLSRGYYKRCHLTAERFLPDPFSGEPGQRMYRTGDRVRYREDGKLLYLGRIDDQIKLRGFRIEPGEIESRLETHSRVKKAFVMVRTVGKEQRLVSYVQARSSTEDERELTTMLQDYLKEALPAYMASTSIVILDAFPLTANGKLDRAALPAPIPKNREKTYPSLQSPTEEIVASIFEEVLGLGSVSVNDHFFELGGHSLLATRVISRIRQTFGVEIALRQFFEAPTVSGLAKAVRSASLDAQDMETPPLAPTPRTARLPLSFSQQRLWFLHRLEPRDPNYNMPTAVRIQGQLSPHTLADALQSVTIRHESLRTTFSQEDGEPIQIINAPQPLIAPLVDLRSLPESERESHARRLVGREAKSPFNLERGPVLRVALLRLNTDEHILLVNMHHIVSDGWSTSVFIRETVLFYQALQEEKKARLPELPIQYADFAVWQRLWLQGDVLDKQMTFWKHQFGHHPQPLDLPTDRPRPPVQTFRGANHGLRLSEAVTNNIRAFTRTKGTTPFMTLLAAFQVLLHRYSGQDEIIVGSPIANRNRAETEPLIGFFVNTLALRTDLSDRPIFADFLARVRDNLLEAYAHQDLPFEKLVEEIQPVRDLSRSPIFQAMFVFQNNPREELELPGLSFQPMGGAGDAAKFDLTLTMAERENRITGLLNYNTDLFNETTMVRFADHFLKVVEACVANPGQAVDEIPLLSESERDQLLFSWNQTQVDGNEGRFVHQLIEEIAADRPDALAVAYQEQLLTYDLLNDRANRLAACLASHGVGPDTPVGLYASRSLELVVGILATLKAGGVYLPLDPGLPLQRLTYILEDTRAPVVLSQTRWLADLEGLAPALIDLEQNISSPAPNPIAALLPNHGAYLLYTSGSTGAPKGVVLTHRGLSNHMLWMHRRFPLKPQDRVVQKTPIGFDASVWEFFAPLMAGAVLTVAGPEGHRDPQSLSRLIKKKRVAILQVVPTLLRLLLQEPTFWRDSPLERVYCGGEPLTTALKNQFHAKLGAALINVYGPTETCIQMMFWESREENDLVSIGRPIENTRLFVLDSRFRPVPIGISGELYIAGSGLARGYHNQPDLTAAHFLPDPFSKEIGQRIYRSGDRVRYLENGNLIYMGRLDHQVKLRGFRIELGEIESLLEAHPTVGEALVVIRSSGDDKRLTAYVRPRADREAEGSDGKPTMGLLDYLAEKLPAYMVPSSLVVLDAFPLTPNGKIDRGALPEPVKTRAEKSYQAPGTPVEEMVAAIFAEILGLTRVGLEDHFFELGGHSLLATRMVSRIRQRFQVEIALRRVFETPTVRGVADAVTRATREARGMSAPPLIAVPREHAPPLSFAQQRLWFLHRLEPGSANYNMPAAVRIRGALHPESLAHALASVATRHETLRTTFVLEDGEPVQVIAPPQPLTVNLADLSGLSGKEKEAQARGLAGREALRPFELERGPLLRTSLLRLAADEHVLLVNMHHIVSDGWSMGIFIREAAAFYQAYQDKKEPNLPELPIQYADFAVWQRQWLQGDVLSKQMAFWKKQLGHHPPHLELPTDRPRPPIQTFRGATTGLKLSTELARALRTFTYAKGVTPFMTLLTAFQVLLHRYSGQDEIIVGSPIANRNRAETEPLIGFFVNTLAVRTDFSDNLVFEDLLARARDNLLEAYAHQDLPFEKLVEEIQPERDLSRSPIFQAMFVYQNNPEEELLLPGLSFQPFQGEGDLAKFELTLTMADSEEGMDGSLNYNADLFDKNTMERFSAHFLKLLEFSVSYPQKELSRSPLLSDTEKDQLLEAWNDTSNTLLRDAHPMDLFDGQVSRQPRAVALHWISSSKQDWTYRQLYNRSNQLARTLTKRGVGPEVLVGISLERSPDMVVAIFGVLKAGGAYCPLDPAYPSQRLAFMIQSSGVSLLITHSSLLETLPEYSGRTLCIDRDWQTIAKEDKHPCPRSTNLQNLAYIIFTSGTTGKPNGVQVSLRGLANLALTEKDTLPITTESRILQFSSLSFDASIWEILSALLNGAILCMADQRAMTPGPEFATMLRAEKITTLTLPPTALAMMGDEQFPDLRTLVTAGEACTSELVRRWADKSRMINAYGPTESTVCATLSICQATDRAPTIGRPIANTRTYVVDRYMEITPIGVAGELCITGLGLARGYLNRPRLTAQKFIPDPFGQKPGQRIYRTGDRVRYMAHGELDFLGRMDQQVKIRGYRIELGEIEAVLNAHPRILQSLVLPWEASPGDIRLIAYIQTTVKTIAEKELDEMMRAKLPEFMVPRTLITIDAFPTTPNGKIDRKALPDPASWQGEKSYQAPGTPVEEMVAAIFAEILGLTRVGLEGHFFELGGHSLLATRMVSRIRQRFQVEIALRRVFGNPHGQRRCQGRCPCNARSPGNERAVADRRPARAGAAVVLCPTTLVVLAPTGARQRLITICPPRSGFGARSIQNHWPTRWRPWRPVTKPCAPPLSWKTANRSRSSRRPNRSP